MTASGNFIDAGKIGSFTDLVLLLDGAARQWREEVWGASKTLADIIVTDIIVQLALPATQHSSRKFYPPTKRLHPAF